MQKAACAILVLALGTGGAAADVWDASVPNDNTIVDTPNMVVHGDTQIHDLAANPGPAADEDWYVVYSARYSSYEFLQTGSTGGIVVPSRLSVERHDAAGGLLQTGNHLGNVLSWADAISLPWENTTGSMQYDFVRVHSASGCGTSCTTNDQYTARFYETTYSIPRFNNSGGQVTVLIVQSLNTDTFVLPIQAHAYFWDTSGSLLATHPMVLPARSVVVVNTATIPGLAGTSGAITVSNTGRYGELSGKAVALEPATGFSFDSPMVPKPH